MTYIGDLIESGTLASFRGEAGGIEDRLLANNKDAGKDAQALITQLRYFQSKVSDWVSELAEEIIKALQWQIDRYNERHTRKEQMTRCEWVPGSCFPREVRP